MPNNEIHIVCFDNPYPAVYGGVIDVFYKIKALHKLGVKIRLHCFVDVFPTETSMLESLTESCYFYKRNKSIFNFLSTKPFSVASRNHHTLWQNLNADKSPILFEGLQSTSVLCAKCFKDRGLFLRLHNLENNYYKGLLKSETNLFKKILYLIESYKYERYLNILAEFDYVFTLSKFETDYVNKLYHNAAYIPVFHGNENVAEVSEYGNYAFYNGDLRICDNKKAADFLIDVFESVDNYPLIIASSIANPALQQRCKLSKNVRYEIIRDQSHLNELSEKAHINVMLSFQESGTKLKAVNALFQSRHVIINSNMIDDKNLQSLCVLAEIKADYIEAIERLKLLPYNDRNNRVRILTDVLDDKKNAKNLVKDIFK